MNRVVGERDPQSGMGKVMFQVPKPGSWGFLRKVDGDDSITTGENAENRANSSDETIRSLTFAENARPSVIELADLLRTVNHREPTYELWRSQCYWWAHTIFEVLHRKYHGSDLTLGDAQGKSGRYLGIKIPIVDNVNDIVGGNGRVFSYFCIIDHSFFVLVPAQPAPPTQPAPPALPA